MQERRVVLGNRERRGVVFGVRLERLEKAGGRDAFWYCLVQCNDRLVRTVPLQITEYWYFRLGTSYLRTGCFRTGYFVLRTLYGVVPLAVDLSLERR